MGDLAKLYSTRFSKKEEEFKKSMWKVLCECFFQKYINKDDTVVDIAGGYCEFINNIKCKKKIVVDLNENVKEYADNDVEVYNKNVTELDFLSENSVDKIFMSNFLEHIDKSLISTLFSKAYNILSNKNGNGGGYIIIMGPNIKYCYKEYWDFFDHHTPLSDRSIIEALEINGFTIVECIDKFLPFSTKSKLPKNLFLIKLYLKLPIFWKIFGKQFLIVAKK